MRDHGKASSLELGTEWPATRLLSRQFLSLNPNKGIKQMPHFFVRKSF